MSIAGIIRALLLPSSVEEWPAVASLGSITLEQIAQRTAVLALACSRCAKAGRFNLTTLIERHGPQLVLIHTEVPEELGGQGLGAVLVKAAARIPPP